MATLNKPTRNRTKRNASDSAARSATRQRPNKTRTSESLIAQATAVAKMQFEPFTATANTPRTISEMVSIMEGPAAALWIALMVLHRGKLALMNFVDERLGETAEYEKFIDTLKEAEATFQEAVQTCSAAQARLLVAFAATNEWPKGSMMRSQLEAEAIP